MLREKLRITMHKQWASNLIGEEICDEGYASIEIDESEIIGNENIIYWMFGIIDGKPKNGRVYCVLSDRTKRNLLPIVKKNVVTNDNEDDNIPENISTKTRIYSDCFRTYQINDFKNMVY